jgi:hypothetical protein
MSNHYNKHYVDKLADKITKSICHKKKHKSSLKDARKSNIININSQNLKYFSHTALILKNAKYSFSGVLSTIQEYRSQLANLHSRILSIMDNLDTTDIIRKEYDELILELYNKLVHFFTMQTVINGISQKAIFDNELDEVSRSINCSYVTKSGIVTNDNIATIDNVTVSIDDLSLTIVIGTFTFNFYKSSGIDSFSINTLINKIDQYETNVIALEKEISKNIHIISQAQNILKLLVHR